MVRQVKHDSRPVTGRRLHTVIIIVSEAHCFVKKGKRALREWKMENVVFGRFRVLVLSVSIYYSPVGGVRSVALIYHSPFTIFT
jgi:hypothetical protein